MLLKPLEYLARIGLETDPERAVKYDWERPLKPKDVRFVQGLNRKIQGSPQFAPARTTAFVGTGWINSQYVPTRRENSRYYNIIAPVSDGICNDPVYLNQALQIYLDEVAKHKGTRVLDICAGTGIYTAFFAANSPDRQFVAMDVSTGMLGQLKLKSERLGLQNVSTRRQDFLRMSEKRQFPLIISVGLYGAVSHYDVLKKASRVVSPGGSVVLMDEMGIDWSKYRGGKPEELPVGDTQDCAELYDFKLPNKRQPVDWRIIRGYGGERTCVTIKTFQKP